MGKLNKQDNIPVCELCGTLMTDFDGWAWYSCPQCGNSVRIIDGKIKWEREFSRKNNSAYSSRDCEYCGQSLAGGSFTLPWENGNNSNGYVICPHCGRACFE